MNEYATPWQLKDYLGLRDSDKAVVESVTGEDVLLRRFCESASRKIDTWTRRKFYPRIETRYYDDDESWRIWLDDDLLEINLLTTGNTGTTITPAQYILWPYGDYPKARIDIDESTGVALSFSGTPQRANAVAGTWGYNSDWARAWVGSGDTLQAAVTDATGTTLTVTSAAGANVQGLAPRFQECHLLKIDDELLYVYAVPLNTSLSVRRGVNGSTAATHLDGAAIYVFEPEPEITLAIQRWGAYLYRQKDSDTFETQAFPEVGMVTTAAGLPADIRQVLDVYTRRETIS